MFLIQRFLRMHLLAFFFLLFFCGVIHANCNSKDYQIYKTKGADFPHKFRALGGAFVSKSSYETAVAEVSGLSPSCARCYGDAYICGWNNCKWDCATESKQCQVCLTNNKCIEDCDLCTEFKKIKIN